MRRLLAGLAALAVLWMYVPAYGDDDVNDMNDVNDVNTSHYILVYKGVMRATDTLFDMNDTNDLVSLSVQSYLAMDINDEGEDKGEVLDSNAVFYDPARKYYKVIPNVADFFIADDPCRAVALEFYIPDRRGECIMMLIGKGKLTKVYKGKGSDETLKKYAPPTMNGMGWVFETDIFADEQALFGTVAVSMKLDAKLTRNANSNGDDVNDVINDIVAHDFTGGWRNWSYDGDGGYMTAPPKSEGD